MAALNHACCINTPSSSRLDVCGPVSAGFSFHGWSEVYGSFTSSALAAWATSQEPLAARKALPRELVRMKSSNNGATNCVSSSLSDTRFAAETGLAGVLEVEEEFSLQDEEEKQGIGSVPLTVAPSCPLPDFSTNADSVTLLNPLGLLPDSVRDADENRRPLLLYVPGMDCTGQGIRSQLLYLFEAGYDIRCVYIPISDRSSWKQLVDLVLPLVLNEIQGANGKNRHLTVLGESYGGCLAMRLAKAAPSLVSRLILINPATNFLRSNPMGSFAAQTGLLATFPEQLYEVAQDILLPLMVKRNRVSTVGTEDFFSPVDFVSAACAAWRLSMLNDNSGLGDEDLSLISMPTLLIASGKDRILSSMTESARLQRLLQQAKRVVLPESGHTALFEDSINIADIMLANGFTHPVLSNSAPSFSPNGVPMSPVAKREEAVADDVMDEMGFILQPWRILTSPLISGVENLPLPYSEPRRPVLFVGNHTMFGIYDSPLLVYELYLRGFRCRGLAHPGHWITGAGSIFERYGNVKATKMAAYKLLKEGENVLLFPGGAREVCKRKGEEYRLLWRETADFVRMAARHKAIIVPFGALGGDEAYKIVYDANEILASPIGPLVKQAYEKVGIDPLNIYPVTALPGTDLPSPFPIPTIERIYFHFGQPIDTYDWASHINDREQAQALYGKIQQVAFVKQVIVWMDGLAEPVPAVRLDDVDNQCTVCCLIEYANWQSNVEVVKQRVEDSILLLKEIRSKDEERELPTRLFAKLGRLLPEFLPRLPFRESGLGKLASEL